MKGREKANTTELRRAQMLAVLGHSPHGLLKAVSHVSNSHGLSIFVGESAIKPFCALVIQVFNNKRAITL